MSEYPASNKDNVHISKNVINKGASPAIDCVT